MAALRLDSVSLCLVLGHKHPSSTLSLFGPTSCQRQHENPDSLMAICPRRQPDCTAFTVFRCDCVASCGGRTRCKSVVESRISALSSTRFLGLRRMMCLSAFSVLLPGHPSPSAAPAPNGKLLSSGAAQRTYSEERAGPRLEALLPCATGMQGRSTLRYPLCPPANNLASHPEIFALACTCPKEQPQLST